MNAISFVSCLVLVGALLQPGFSDASDSPASQPAAEENRESLAAGSPASLVIQEGQKFTLICYVVAVTTWRKDGRPITLQGRFKRIRIGPMHPLEVSNAQQSDDGIYECVFGGRTVKSWSVNVYPAAIVSIDGINPVDNSIEGYAGATLKLRCVSKFSSDVNWIHDGGFAEHLPRFSISRSRLSAGSYEAILTIRSLHHSNAGDYTCIGYPEFSGPLTEVALRLKVHRSEPARFSMAPVSVSAYEGHRVVLNCKATGIPSPNVNWVRLVNSSSVGTSTVKLAPVNGGQHAIAALSHGDEGVYRCVAENVISSVSKEIRVSVRIADYFHRIDVSLNNAQEKRSILMTCNMGIFAKVMWLKDGKTLNSNHSRLLFPEYNLGTALIISPASPHDRGLYEARAFAKDLVVYKCHIDLSIRGIPSPPQNVTASIQINASDINTLALSWISPLNSGGEENLLYIVKVTKIDLRHLKIAHRVVVETGVTDNVLQLNFNKDSDCTVTFLVEVFARNSFGESKAALPENVSNETLALKQNCTRRIYSSPLLKSYPGFQMKLKDVSRSCFKSFEGLDFDEAVKDAVHHYAKAAYETDKSFSLTTELISNWRWDHFVVRGLPVGLNVEESLQMVKAIERPLRYDFKKRSGLTGMQQKGCGLIIQNCNYFYAKGIKRVGDCEVDGISRNAGCKVTSVLRQIRKFCK